jgi:hypothetical protein
MKSKEEIKQLAQEVHYESQNQGLDENGCFNQYQGFIKGYTQCQQDMAKDQTVTRFEVIDENGRAYTRPYCKVELSYQDDGRTLKVFINSLNKQD